jgi:hypothetical protein
VAVLTVTNLTRTGDGKSFVAADVAGDLVPNGDGKTLLYFRNTNAAPRIVTVNSVRPCDQGFDHNEQITVAATTGDEICGPYDPARFNNDSGQLSLTYDAVTNLTVACVRVP